MTAEPTYTLTLTATQLQCVRDACELLSRIHIGQLEHVEEKLQGLPHEASLTLRDALQQLNPLVTDLPNVHASRALNERMKLSHEVAWGIYHAVRYRLYLDHRAAQDPQESDLWTVLSHPPMPQGGQPIPEVIRR